MNILRRPGCGRTCRARWQLGTDRVADAIGQRRHAIEVLEVVLELADEAVVVAHAVLSFISNRASASTAARRCFNA